jgi:spermidine synthase
LNDPACVIVNTDAYTWLEGNRETFDLIVIDFPDPTNFALGKLYTTSFYQRADQALAAGGYMVVQTTSPLIARQSFWTVVTHDRSRGPEHHAAACARAELWRMGLRHRRPPALARCRPRCHRACVS